MKSLSEREMEIVKLIAWGYLKKEIAAHLGISYYTVDAHVRNIYRKLNITKETDLTRWYFFKEYDIKAENPYRRAIAIFLLILAIAGIFENQAVVRVLRAPQARVNRVQLRTGRRNRRDDAIFPLVA